MANSIYYKFICIDETHAIIAEQQQLNNSEIDKLKSKRLGRAVIISISNSASSTEPIRGSIDKEGLEQNELSEINYLISSVRVHAMAYDDELSQYDIESLRP